MHKLAKNVDRTNERIKYNTRKLRRATKIALAKIAKKGE
jgi:hypothetical protein